MDTIEKWSKDFVALIERVKPLVKTCDDAKNKIPVSAVALLQAATEHRDECFLDSVCEVIGSWNDSEIFILEMNKKERKIVQAGFLPIGATISFTNN